MEQAALAEVAQAIVKYVADSCSSYGPNRASKLVHLRRLYRGRLSFPPEVEGNWKGRLTVALAHQVVVWVEDW